MEQVTRNQAQLECWAQHAPANYRHKHALVEALRTSITGQHWLSMDLFQAAIDGAQEGGFLHEEAMARELTAEFYFLRSTALLPYLQTIGAHAGVFTRIRVASGCQRLSARGVLPVHAVGLAGKGEAAAGSPAAARDSARLRAGSLVPIGRRRFPDRDVIRRGAILRPVHAIVVAVIGVVAAVFRVIALSDDAGCRRRLPGSGDPDQELAGHALRGRHRQAAGQAHDQRHGEFGRRSVRAAAQAQGPIPRRGQRPVRRRGAAADLHLLARRPGRGGCPAAHGDQLRHDQARHGPVRRRAARGSVGGRPVHGRRPAAVAPVHARRAHGQAAGRALPGELVRRVRLQQETLLARFHHLLPGN
jgi:hypothetical protein